MAVTDRLSPHIVLWPLLVGFSAATAAVEPQLAQQLSSGDASLPGELWGSTVEWLLGSASVVVAGVLAVLVARPARTVLPVVAVCWSVVVEILGEALRPQLPVGISHTFGSSAVYALSGMLLAAAWLTARGRELSTLAAVPFAGVASWLTFPTVSSAMYTRVHDWFGDGFGALTLALFTGFAMTALVVGLPSVVVTVWRRIRPAMPVASEGL